jgi:2-keto-4-pentenoate hydratase/2-oxohepta-3-ene-1,7-dioic acid hydratase in catechol pathway
MIFARLGAQGSEIPVLQHEGDSYDLRPLTADLDGAFLAGGGLAAAEEALAAGRLDRLEGTEGLRVGAPVARPGKVVCIGLNYRDHAAETGAAIPAEPVVFMKDPSTVVGPFDDVLVPRDSVKTDWEVELGVVIGRTARYLDTDGEALGCVAGYAVSHDVSEREFQLERGGQWDKGKSCETFNPLGPWLVPAGQVADPQALGLRLWVNGTPRQNGTTADMIFPVAHVIRYLSRFMVLHPGDVINTGTPAGVALGLPGNPYLRAGDVVELEVDGLGRARQTVVQA